MNAKEMHAMMMKGEKRVISMYEFFRDAKMEFVGKFVIALYNSIDDAIIRRINRNIKTR